MIFHYHPLPINPYIPQLDSVDNKDPSYITPHPPHMEYKDCIDCDIWYK